MKDEQSRNQQRDQSNDGSSEQGINFTDRSPIAVGAEDYNWNPQRPFPAPNHDWAIGKNHNGGKGTTASVSTDLPIAQLSLKEGRPYQSIDKDFSPSHPKKIKQEKIHNVNVQKQTSRSRDDKKKKLGKKIEKDAAKNAAIYYGECYLEGVNMRHADKAARESHAGYKKWWLQQIQDENPITTLGDAYNVPLYNSPSKIPAQIKSRQEQMSLARDETRDIGGAANLAALATATHQSSAHSLAYSKCTTPGEMFDRSSGIRNPSPSKLTQTQAQTLGEKENRRAKKKKRSFSKLSRSIYDTCLGKNSQSDQRNISWDAVSTKNNAMYNVSQSQQCKASAIPIPSASHGNAYIYGIDPNATTDDDVPVPDQHSIGSQSLYKAHFQRERRNGQRRESSSCDRNDETHSTDPPRRTTASSDESSEEGNAVCQYFGNNGGISISNPNTTDNMKLEVIRALAVSGGDVTSTQFLSALDQLRRLYAMTCFDARLGHKSNKKKIEGNWLTISRPHFQECLGSNSSGEYMYTLGRLSFDMFAPGNLICSIGGIFNSIETVDVHSDTCALKSIPKSLKVEVEKGESILRRYDIITTFSIEPGSPMFGFQSPNQNVSKRILRGTITTYGYVLPDPSKANRLSIWFSGGRIEPHVEENEIEHWKKAFGCGAFSRHLKEKARVLAAKLLLGASVPSKMEDDGSMEFGLSRPIGGHGTAYVDVLYCDENLRIVQGHKGSLFVFTRVST